MNRNRVCIFASTGSDRIQQYTINGVFMTANPLYPILAALGLLLMVIALIRWLRTNQSVSQSLDATGTVIGQEESDDEGIVYTAIVQFTANDGTVVEFTDSIRT